MAKTTLDAYVALHSRRRNMRNRARRSLDGGRMSPAPDRVFVAHELCGSTLPSRIRDLGDPPGVLYTHGELPRGPAVAIVGTREPTASSLLYARHLAGTLASEGVAILSGGARGIDTAAHRGALDVGGVTVVVAPCGFEHPYPAENGELYREIVERGGAYVSATRTEIVASYPSFFLRNRLMVALAHVVVVVEAPWRSGARNTSMHARRLGRPLYVVPHPPWNPRGSGAAVELRLGARPLASARDVLRELAAQRAHPIGGGRETTGLPVPPPTPEPVFAPRGRGAPRERHR